MWLHLFRRMNVWRKRFLRNVPALRSRTARSASSSIRTRGQDSVQHSHFRYDFLLFCIFLCFVYFVLLPALFPVTSCPVLTVMPNKIVTRGCLCLCRYVEQSNLLMEQRNDSLKNSSEQNQGRILQAEQDKVTLLNSPIHYTHTHTHTQ